MLVPQYITPTHMQQVPIILMLVQLVCCGQRHRRSAASFLSPVHVCQPDRTNRTNNNQYQRT